MTFSIAKDFSRFPAGRVKADGPCSGEHLREMVLARLQEGPLMVDFDGTAGFGSSFLQGAFQGLADETDVSRLYLTCTEDPTIVTEVLTYLKD